MLWPVIFLMIVLLLAIAASVPGITKASTLSNSIKTMQCGVAITFDDLLNGNVTTDNTSFFMGVSTLATYLTSFSANITTIINDFTNNLGTTIGQINGNLTNA
jgi:predicted PurR-regulated permease PerM